MINSNNLSKLGGDYFPVSLYVLGPLLKEEGIRMMCGFPATHEF
jgi:hypothetical protein